jgi:hypothetical protein
VAFRSQIFTAGFSYPQYCHFYCGNLESLSFHNQLYTFERGVCRHLRNIISFWQAIDIHTDQNSYVSIFLQRLPVIFTTKAPMLRYFTFLFCFVGISNIGALGCRKSGRRYMRHRNIDKLICSILLTSKGLIPLFLFCRSIDT